MSDIKKREKVQSACSNPDARADSSKRARAVTHADTDKALIIWFRRKAVLPDIRIDGSMLLIQANKFCVQLSAVAFAEGSASHAGSVLPAHSHATTSH